MHSTVPARTLRPQCVLSSERRSVVPRIPRKLTNFLRKDVICLVVVANSTSDMGLGKPAVATRLKRLNKRKKRKRKKRKWKGRFWGCLQLFSQPPPPSYTSSSSIHCTSPSSSTHSVKKRKSFINVEMKEKVEENEARIIIEPDKPDWVYCRDILKSANFKSPVSENVSY